MRRYEKREFLVILGSIKFSKWLRKNLTTAHYEQYYGKEGVPALKLEAIPGDLLWISHFCVGIPRCANDIKFLDASTFSKNIADGSYPPPLELTIAG